MTLSPPTLAFDSSALLDQLDALSADELDTLPFGVIGFDASGTVQRYNRHEATAALMEQASVVGQHVFVELAPCMNNYLIAGRFEDSVDQNEALDAVMPYVLTFRMRPTRVHLRLLSRPGHPHRYVLVKRSQGGAA